MPTLAQIGGVFRATPDWAARPFLNESRYNPATGGGPHHAKHVSIGLRGWVLGRATKEKVSCTLCTLCTHHCYITLGNLSRKYIIRFSVRESSFLCARGAGAPLALWAAAAPLGSQTAHVEVEFLG